MHSYFHVYIYAPNKIGAKRGEINVVWKFPFLQESLNTVVEWDAVSLVLKKNGLQETTMFNAITKVEHCLTEDITSAFST